MNDFNSRISIPAELGFIRPVTAYVVELAKNIGFNEDETGKIELALEEGLSNVIQFGYEEGNDSSFDVIFESQATGIVIRIAEKGMPFNPERLPDYQADNPETDTSGAGLGLYLIKSLMDELAFIRKGREGQEIRMVKHLPQKRINHILKMEKENRPAPKISASDNTEYTGNYSVRQMIPDEAVEISKCAYQCYGYGYEDFIYYPEQVAAKNRDGSIFSVVAVNEDNAVMGHAALEYPYPGASIAESGVAFVKPEYRRLGLFAEFNAFFIQHAKKRGMAGLYGRAVTSHIATQRMAKSHGYMDCGLFIGNYTALDFSGFAEKVAQRESLVMSFLAFKTDQTRTIYLPKNFLALGEMIFKSINLPVELPQPSLELGPCADNSIIEVTNNHTLNLAEITVSQYGEHFIEEIRHYLKSLCLENTDIIHIVLDLEDSATENVIERLGQMGFVFGGILPFGLNGHHALILQYLNNVKIDFDQINLLTDEAKIILEQIKKSINT